jgi:peptide/nickel transport system permease protein
VISSLVFRRVASGVLVIFLVSVLVFVATELVPGNTAQFVVGRDADPSALATVSHQLGLDRPATTRYADWLGNAVQGNLGHSLIYGIPVSSYLGVRLRNTAVLAGVTLLFLIPLSLLFGGLCAMRRDTFFDRSISTVSLVLTSIPEFVLGIALVTIFAVRLHLLPAIASITFDPSLGSWTKSLVLPVACLLGISLAQTVRMVRGSTIEVLDSEFIEASRLRGVPERRVLWGHAVPNALGPAIQVLAINAAWLIGGIVIVENVFNYPGIGQALLEALIAHDVPVIQAIACLLAACFILVNLLADIGIIILTPRLRTAR